MNGLDASRPCATETSSGALPPSAIRSSVFSVPSASTIMIATSSPTMRPATTMLKVAFASCDQVGNATHWSSIRATRTPPTGPENGRPAIWVDADAALMASTSYGSSGFRLWTVMTTWISLRRPSVNDGRSGRSIRRQVRIASVEGRPSRRKNAPGMRPAAYMRSSTSTVRGKKSKWSFGCFDAVVAESSMVSSSRYATTAPHGLLGQAARLEADGAGAETAVVDHGFCFVHGDSGGVGHRVFLLFSSFVRRESPTLGPVSLKDARGVMPVFDRSPRDSSREPLPRTGGRFLVRARAVVLLNRRGATGGHSPSGSSYRRRPRRWISAR